MLSCVAREKSVLQIHVVIISKFFRLKSRSFSNLMLEYGNIYLMEEVLEQQYLQFTDITISRLCNIQRSLQL